MELIDELVKNLGISDNAARGGAGLLFNLAKDKMPAGDFNKVASTVPGINELMGAAPESGGLLGGLGNLSSGLGGDAAKLGNLASLAGGFSQLGLDSGMIGKFIPIILAFVQNKGGNAVSTLLGKVLQ